MNNFIGKISEKVEKILKERGHNDASSVIHLELNSTVNSGDNVEPLILATHLIDTSQRGSLDNHYERRGTGTSIYDTLCVMIEGGDISGDDHIPFLTDWIISNKGEIHIGLHRDGGYFLTLWLHTVSYKQKYGDIIMTFHRDSIQDLLDPKTFQGMQLETKEYQKMKENLFNLNNIVNYIRGNYSHR